MNKGKYVFSQLLDFLDRNDFNYLARKYEGDKYSRGNYLEQTCPGSPWYELKYHGNYLTIAGEDPIVVVDPEGGPYIVAGSLLARVQSNGDSADRRRRQDFAENE